MAHRRTSLLRTCHDGLRALAAAGLFFVVVPACELLLDSLPEPGTSDCEQLCTLEDDCGLRPYAACVAESCDDAGVRAGSDTDECMLAVETCADAALCTCDESCTKLDECTGSPDPECAETCESLVEQDVVASFQENRCRIESTCEDLPTCGGL